MRLISDRRGLGAAILGLTVVLTACGSGKNSAAPSGSTAAAAADTAGARALIEPFVGHPSAFPIDTPLAKSAAGKRIAVMDCGTPVCSLFFTLAQPAAAALGMQVTQVKAGLAADSVAAAFNTVVQAKYDGVFVPAIQPSLWQRGLDQLVQAKIPVVTTGIVGGDPAKINASQVSDKAIQLAGKLLAAYVVNDTGDKTNVVFYVTPEIAFNPVLADAFQAEMKTLCPACPSRTAKVPAATMGTSAPSLIVNDLQANPKTTTAVFGEANQAAALPSALKVAGVSVKTLATFPDPQSLQQVKSKQIDAALAVDLPVDAWTLMDSLARLTTGGVVTDGAKADTPPMQFLTAAELPGDVSHGWTGYPDFAAKFTALWKQAA